MAASSRMLRDPAMVPGGVIFLGHFVRLPSAACDFRDIRRDLVAAGLLGREAATLSAVSVIAVAAPNVLRLLFGPAILAAVALSVTAPRLEPSLLRTARAGVLSGRVGTLTGVGTSPFAIAPQNAPAPALRATLNAVLLLGAILSLGAQASFGACVVAAAASLLPAVLAELLAARWIIRDPRLAAALRPAFPAL